VKSEEENQIILQEALQRFLEIVLQADLKSIVSPYLELDRNNRSVSDLSAASPVSSIDSYHVLKNFFFAYHQEMMKEWAGAVLY
jgi:hypothetical protein